MFSNIFKGPEWWERAKRVIPGGNQFLSKRSELFLPGYWPAYYLEASGIRVTDLDGNVWVDFSSLGAGACILGYADPDVNAAAHDAVDRCVATSLNCPEEVELAELLCEIHPWAEMVRYARTGGEALAVAVRIARAKSGKDRVAFCGYHGWSDWYLAANIASEKNLDGHLLSGLAPTGVPRVLRGMALPFTYNNIKELENLVAAHADIGVIVIEPMRHQPPTEKFLQGVRAVADRIGAVLIVDEMTSGWRFRLGGLHMNFGLRPDIAVFGKAISNGYAMSAVIGTRDVMQAAQETFISSTSWSERIGPAVALATIAKLKERKVFAHLDRVGTLLIDGWKRLAEVHGLDVDVQGPPPMPVMGFPRSGQAQALATLFTQEMLKRGFLAGTGTYMTYAHQPEDVNRCLEAVDETFAILADAERRGDAAARLCGPVKHGGFWRLT
jgi:glutamate-1-semialdehyde 2,1-aminomutase